MWGSDSRMVTPGAVLLLPSGRRRRAAERPRLREEAGALSAQGGELGGQRRGGVPVPIPLQLHPPVLGRSQVPEGPWICPWSSPVSLSVLARFQPPELTPKRLR